MSQLTKQEINLENLELVNKMDFIRAQMSELRLLILAHGSAQMLEKFSVIHDRVLKRLDNNYSLNTTDIVLGLLGLGLFVVPWVYGIYYIILYVLKITNWS